MNKSVTVFLSSFLIFLFSVTLHSQDIQVIANETHLYDTLGAEIVFDFEIINISQANQVVFEVRTINTMPQGWMSSLCFGENCFAPNVDSIATTPEFFTDELAPGDTLLSSLHVFTGETNGTSNTQIQFATFRAPDDRIIKDFSATTLLNDVKDPVKLNAFALMQNYPNPFNPSTEISFNLKSSSFVSLKVFNLLGQEVANLLNGNLHQGMHSVKFDASKLNSGVYLYRLDAKGFDGSTFSSVKKMILTK